MPTTPNLGITYPDGSAVPSRLTWVENPIKSVDTQVAALLAALGMNGLKIQYGTFTQSVTTTASDNTVTFPVPFAGTPTVFCTVIDTAAASSGHRVDSWGATAGSTVGQGTTTGFSFRSQRNSTTANIRVNWIAIGPA